MWDTISAQLLAKHDCGMNEKYGDNLTLASLQPEKWKQSLTWEILLFVFMACLLVFVP